MITFVKTETYWIRSRSISETKPKIPCDVIQKKRKKMTSRDILDFALTDYHCIGQLGKQKISKEYFPLKGLKSYSQTNQLSFRIFLCMYGRSS